MLSPKTFSVIIAHKKYLEILPTPLYPYYLNALSLSIMNE